ncbi:hypothetical protein E9993_05175 [Labilibacter sediminis]|nr:hypothetical protein E9993_05175 [Labilibacter sediminis]
MKQLFILIVLVLGITFITKAQHENSLVNDNDIIEENNQLDWDMSLTMKSQNIFRGLLPSESPAMATQVGVIYKDWVFGMYGGVGLNGVYQETDFIIAYRKPRYNIRLDYYYNFTQGITDIPDPSGIFDFNKQTTRGLLDLMVNIQLDEKGHWNLKTSTLLFGRDNELEYLQQGNETITRRGAQRYSQYLALEYNWYWGENKIKAHAGGAFSLNDPSGQHFYGKHAGFNDIGIAFTRNIKLNNEVKLPIKVATVFNPLAGRSYVNFSIDLIPLCTL